MDRGALPDEAAVAADALWPMGQSDGAALDRHFGVAETILAALASAATPAPVPAAAPAGRERRTAA